MIMQETNNEPCAVGGLVLLERCLSQPTFDRKAFENRLRERLLERHVRFRSIVLGDSHFVDIGAQAVEMENHLKYATLPMNSGKGKSEDEVLSSFVESRLFKPFTKVSKTVSGNDAIPLWECIVIENYSRGLICFFRIHHWIGDGTLLQKIIVCDLLDDEQNIHNFIEKSTSMRGSHSNWTSALAIINSLVMWCRNNIPLIGSLIGTVVGFILKVISFVLTFFLIGYIGFTKDGDSIFKVSPKNKKSGQISCSFIWFNDTEQDCNSEDDLRNETDRYFTVDEFKRVAKQMGGTFNDLFLTLLSGGADRYRLKLCKKNKSSDELLNTCNARIGMGVNIRSDESKQEHGNIVGVIFSSIPLNVKFINDPSSRFDSVKAHMNFSKFLPQPYFNRYLLWLGTMFLPRKLAVSLMNWGASSTTFTCSNVQGVSLPDDETISFKLLGHNMLQGAGFIPLVAAVGVNCTVLSFNNRVGLTVVSDKAMVEDSHLFAECIREEFQSIRKFLSQ